ncbi:hypothetical protein LZ554_003030 [Drepanopeziza brunnea f. sp. 'monogermtubi']|nr:hypothetical protein LZ554_003030 [Drepanopeziza brunnea f. sp. 'monogermtubi']
MPHFTRSDDFGHPSCVASMKLRLQTCPQGLLLASMPNSRQGIRHSHIWFEFCSAKPTRNRRLSDDLQPRRPEWHELDKFYSWTSPILASAFLKSRGIPLSESAQTTSYQSASAFETSTTRDGNMDPEIPQTTISSPIAYMQRRTVLVPSHRGSPKNLVASVSQLLSLFDITTHFFAVIKQPRTSIKTPSSSRPMASTSSETAATQSTVEQTDVAHVNIPESSQADGAEASGAQPAITEPEIDQPISTQPKPNILEPTRNDPAHLPEPVVSQSDKASPAKTSRASKLPFLGNILKSPTSSLKSGAAPAAPSSTSEISQTPQAIDAVFSEQNGASNEAMEGSEPSTSRIPLLAALRNRGSSLKRNSSQSDRNETITREPISDQAPTLPQLSAHSPLNQQTEMDATVQPMPIEPSFSIETPPASEAAESTPVKHPFLANIKTKRNSFQQRFAKPANVAPVDPIVAQAATIPPSAATPPPLIIPTRPPRKAATPDATGAASKSTKDSFIESLRARRQAAFPSKASPPPASNPIDTTEPEPATTETNATQPAAASPAPPTLVIPTRPPRKTNASGAAPKATKGSLIGTLKAKGQAAFQTKAAPATEPTDAQPDPAPSSTDPPALVIPTRPRRQQNTSEPVKAPGSFIGGLTARRKAAFKSKSTEPANSEPAIAESGPEPAAETTVPPAAAPSALIIPTRPPRQAATPATSTPYRLPFLPAKRARQPSTSVPIAAALLAPVTLVYPPPSTNPLFQPLSTYGPTTLKNRIKWQLLQALSTIMSTLGISAIAAAFILRALVRAITRRIRRQKKQPRIFEREEKRRAELRRLDDISWTKRELQAKSAFPEIANSVDLDSQSTMAAHNGYMPTEGGPDKFVVDVAYYARRVGLNSEEVRVQTEDGHVLTLWHVYDPREYTPMTRAQRMIRGPESIDEIRAPSRPIQGAMGGGQKLKQKYPLLLIPGLLQSAGIYCTNDEHSLAFWLCKQGYDVWLGNMRSGFKPEHIDLKRGDPKMWNWDIRHMATLDLPALTARVLSETSCEKLGLIAHSQGTAASLIALSKLQRPSLGAHISVLCCLAPAAYAGPDLNKPHFKIMRAMSPSLARKTVGVKAFLPGLRLAQLAQGRVPQKYLGGPTYQIQKQLFGWTDERWDRGVRDRNFMFSPTVISATAMLWWLGSSGFAAHGSILAPRSQVERELEEDLLQDYFRNLPGKISEDVATSLLEKHVKQPTQVESWFDERSPPMAFWAPGEDTLCDGQALINRFERGREPDARVLGATVLEDMGHLDVVWAVDVIEKVGTGLRDTVWKSLGKKERDIFRMPAGCEGVELWVDDRRVSEKEAEAEAEEEAAHE